MKKNKLESTTIILAYLLFIELLMGICECEYN